MKMKTIIDKMNTKDDPRSNLLQSLKPYLKDSRKIIYYLLILLVINNCWITFTSCFNIFIYIIITIIYITIIYL